MPQRSIMLLLHHCRGQVMITRITQYLTHATWVIQKMKQDKTNLIRYLLPWSVLFFHSQLHIQTRLFAKEMKTDPINESRFGSNWNQIDYIYHALCIYIRRPLLKFKLVSFYAVQSSNQMYWLNKSLPILFFSAEAE